MNILGVGYGVQWYNTWILSMREICIQSTALGKLFLSSKKCIISTAQEWGTWAHWWKDEIGGMGLEVGILYACRPIVNDYKLWCLNGNRLGLEP